MEFAHAVEFDPAVVHPDHLQQVGCLRRAFPEKCGLVHQSKDVAHWTARTGSGHAQPVVEVSRKSLNAPERLRRRASFVLASPG